MDVASDVPSYQHDVDGMPKVEIDVPSEIPTQPPCDEVVDDSGTKYANEDYEYLILKPDHFKRGKSIIGKDIMQDENPNDTLKK